jgi:hypothetical protein
MQDTKMVARTQERTHFSAGGESYFETEDQPSVSAVCGARTRSGEPCDRTPEPDKRRCRLHGGAPGSGAPRGNTNAKKHGRYSDKSRELRALGRVQIRTENLARAQLAVMNSRARGDPHRVEIAEERVSRCMQRLAKAALALERVLAERGNEDGRQRLVEGALRITAHV